MQTSGLDVLQASSSFGPQCLLALQPFSRELEEARCFPHCHHLLGDAFKLSLSCLVLAWAVLQPTCIWLCTLVDPDLWAWLSCLSSALTGDLNCWPALLVFFGTLWDMPLSVSCSLCVPVTLSSWLTVPFRAALPLLLPNTQLRFHICPAAVSGAGLARACLGVCACHCSSLNKPACSLTACLGTPSTMVALCNAALTSLPSVSKFCVHLFHIKHCTIFANTVLVLMTPAKVPEIKRIPFDYSWMNAVVAWGTLDHCTALLWCHTLFFNRALQEQVCGREKRAGSQASHWECNHCLQKAHV